jgi:signal transduction histidine kinase
VVGDARRVRQILLNLLSNAVKFGEGKPVEVRCTPAEGGIVVEVADHGPGIPSGDLERIFEDFVQLGEPGVGTGLGLPIARRLAELQGGTLRVDSVPGEGSTFRLFLPSEAPDLAHGGGFPFTVSSAILR